MISQFSEIFFGIKEKFCHCSLAEIVMIFISMVAVVALAAFVG